MGGQGSGWKAGRALSLRHKERVSEGKRAKMTDEIRQKLRAVNIAKWKDPAYRARMLPTRNRSYVLETRLLETIKPEFEFVERANRICDFIGFRNGQIYLIEAKLTKSSHLRPIQSRAKEIAGTFYLVRTYGGQ